MRGQAAGYPTYTLKTAKEKSCNRNLQGCLRKGEKEDLIFLDESSRDELS